MEPRVGAQPKTLRIINKDLSASFWLQISSNFMKIAIKPDKDFVYVTLDTAVLSIIFAISPAVTAQTNTLASFFISEGT